MDFANSIFRFCLVFIQFRLGLFGFSFSTLVIVVFTSVFRSWRNAAILRRKLLLLFLKSIHGGNYDLWSIMGAWPSSVNFSKIEKSSLLNYILRHLWPFAKAAIEDQLLQTLQPLLASVKPSFLPELAFSSLDLGFNPPVITGTPLSLI